MTYWLSQRGKELQTILEEDYELPTYAVFVVIAVATILIGLLLGGVRTYYVCVFCVCVCVLCVCVCVCDVVCTCVCVYIEIIHVAAKVYT